ncbi:hypothetical protein LMIY3S_02907 [Labrys miyagiensis]
MHQPGGWHAEMSPLLHLRNREARTWACHAAVQHNERLPVHSPFPIPKDIPWNKPKF